MFSKGVSIWFASHVEKKGRKSGHTVTLRFRTTSYTYTAIVLGVERVSYGKPFYIYSISKISY